MKLKELVLDDLDAEDCATLLFAAEALSTMTSMAAMGEEASQQFVSDGAHYVGELIRVARRLERHLETLSAQSDSASEGVVNTAA